MREEIVGGRGCRRRRLSEEVLEGGSWRRLLEGEVVGGRGRVLRVFCLLCLRMLLTQSRSGERAYLRQRLVGSLRLRCCDLCRPDRCPISRIDLHRRLLFHLFPNLNLIPPLPCLYFAWLCADQVGYSGKQDSSARGRGEGDGGR